MPRTDDERTDAVAWVEIIGWIIHINRFADEPNSRDFLPGTGPLHRADTSFPTMLDRQRFSGNGRRISAEARAETMQPGYFSAPVQTRSLNRSLGPSTCGIDSKSTATVSTVLFLSETPERRMHPDFQPRLCFSGQKVILRGIGRVRNWFISMYKKWSSSLDIWIYRKERGYFEDALRRDPSLPFYIISK